VCFFFSSRRRHTRCYRDWSSDVCSSDLSQKLQDGPRAPAPRNGARGVGTKKLWHPRHSRSRSALSRKRRRSLRSCQAQGARGRHLGLALAPPFPPSARPAPQSSVLVSKFAAREKISSCCRGTPPFARTPCQAMSTLPFTAFFN